MKSNANELLASRPAGWEIESPRLDPELGTQIAKLAGISDSDKIARLCDQIGEDIAGAYCDWERNDLAAMNLAQVRRDVQRVSQRLIKWKIALKGGENSKSARADLATFDAASWVEAYREDGVFEQTLNALSDFVDAVHFAENALIGGLRRKDGRPWIHNLIYNLEVCALSLGGGFTFDKNYLPVRGTLIQTLELLRKHFPLLIPQEHSPTYQRDLNVARQDWQHFYWRRLEIDDRWGLLDRRAVPELT